MRTAFARVVVALVVSVAEAEPLKIIGFETASGITFQGATVGNYYTLEFAPTVSGPWTNWGSVCGQAITGTVMATPAPFFYRIRQTDGSEFRGLTSAPAGMVLVPGGTFRMGWDPGDVALYEHQVTLSPFALAKCEVTYGQWDAVRQWATNSGYQFQHSGREGTYGRDGAAPTARCGEPVTMVSWRDAIVWCNARSEQEGLTPVYLHDGQVLRSSLDSSGHVWENTLFNTAANGYRLPTEAEWEYAARHVDQWSSTPGDWASGATDACTNADAVVEVAWTGASGIDRAHLCGGKRPNQLGLFDMSGNVSEWCWDGTMSWYGVGAVTNPVGTATYDYRVRRGGTYNVPVTFLRSAGRDINTSDDVRGSVGFRIARSQP